MPSPCLCLTSPVHITQHTILQHALTWVTHGGIRRAQPGPTEELVKSDSGSSLAAGSNAEQLTALAAGCGPAPGNIRARVYLNCPEEQLKPTRASCGHFLLSLISRRGQCLISQERQDANKQVLEKTLHLKLLLFFLSATSESNMRFFSSPLHSGNRLYPSISISEEIIFV